MARVTGSLVRYFAVLVVGLVTAILGSAPVHADTRVALVIRNSAYQNVARLTNPTADAEAIAATLRGLGFTGAVFAPVSRNDAFADIRAALVIGQCAARTTKGKATHQSTWTP
jgi:hypothetical protein